MEVALTGFAQLLFLLLAAHAVADFPLQGDTMSAAKAGKVPGRPWYMALACHGLIHGGFVSLVMMTTGRPAFWWLGTVEACAHAGIDFAKGRGAFGIKADQALHLGCKLAWAIIAIGGSWS